MSAINFDHHPQFFTATILEWNRLLMIDAMKDIIVNSLCYLVEEQRVTIFGFVIMPNHVHLIWQIRDGHQSGKFNKVCSGLRPSE